MSYKELTSAELKGILGGEALVINFGVKSNHRPIYTRPVESPQFETI